MCEIEQQFAIELYTYVCPFLGLKAEISYTNVMVLICKPIISGVGASSESENQNQNWNN